MSALQSILFNKLKKENDMDYVKRKLSDCCSCIKYDGIHDAKYVNSIEFYNPNSNLWIRARD